MNHSPWGGYRQKARAFNATDAAEPVTCPDLSPHRCPEKEAADAAPRVGRLR